MKCNRCGYAKIEKKDIINPQTKKVVGYIVRCLSCNKVFDEKIF